LEKLENNGTITPVEYETLTETFANVEQYLREKDRDVEKAVKDMGDENYIPWSERVREEGRAEMREQLAEKEERIRELERQLEKLKKENA
jgi:alkylated DNA nucleotide flippase Atl1